MTRTVTFPSTVLRMGFLHYQPRNEKISSLIR